jgi:uncharacterized protein (DUF2141 family)
MGTIGAAAGLPGRCLMNRSKAGLLFGALLFVAGLAAAEEAPPAEDGRGSLTVVVPGLASNDGKVIIALFNSAEDFEKEGDIVSSAFVEPEDQRAVWTFGDLPFGEYALRLFHDANDNEKLDTNWMGIPKEPYGFSNDARGKFGPPGYEAAKFLFESDGMTLEIKLE